MPGDVVETGFAFHPLGLLLATSRSEHHGFEWTEGLILWSTGGLEWIDLGFVGKVRCAD